jgi:hypothetical protein
MRLLALVAILPLVACVGPSRGAPLMVRLDMIDRGLVSLDEELKGTAEIETAKHSIADTRVALTRAQQAVIAWKWGDGRQVNDRVEDLSQSLVRLRTALGQTVREPIGLFDALPPRPVVNGIREECRVLGQSCP